MTELRIRNPFPGAVSYHIPATGSTMDEARILSETTRYGLVRAGEQSAGRGRLSDRRWHGDAGSSLLVTFWFPAGEFQAAPLPLVAGIAFARACGSWAEATGARFRTALRLKWPNDALCGDRKLAGMLCESSGETIYAGIGVNCSQSAFPTGFRTEATSIYLETGIVPELDDLLERLAAAFHALRGAGASAWKDEYESLLAWKGQSVRFSPGLGGAAAEGVLRGVDGSGSIVIRRRDGESVRDDAHASGELARAVIDEGTGT